MDLEFLTNDHGQRVAAFGFMAGFTGAAVGLMQWCHAQINNGGALPAITPFKNEAEMTTEIKAQLAAAIAASGNPPSVIIMGALGRCGRAYPVLSSTLTLLCFRWPVDICPFHPC